MCEKCHCEEFVLPPLNIHPVFIETEYNPSDMLVFTHLRGLDDRADIRRNMAAKRLEYLNNILATDNGQWIIWVGMDVESKMVSNAIEGSIEVSGSDSPEYKAKAFEDFQDGKHKVLVSKGRIAGFGMNFQCSHNMCFFGISDSWELWYQCIRREWRFGQKEPVNVYALMLDIEAEIYQNVMRKDALAARLRQEMIKLIRGYEEDELMNRTHQDETYREDVAKGDNWTLMLGDSCKRLSEIEESSISMSCYSPPFADLYTYSNSDHDLGNSRNWSQFFEHYAFIVREMLRVTKPGRLTCAHTSDIPAMMGKDGYIGIKDFPGEVIKLYEKEGWTFVGRCFIPKSPQAQAIRTHVSSLLFVQMRKDSTMSRPALIDQILLFKKPGENAVPVTPVENGELSNDLWIEWANGVWNGIKETETLQYHDARDPLDDKHICPLQLETIERCIRLWSNRGEIVLDPFAGIGSTGFVALKWGRRFVGIELKESYWREAKKNLETATIKTQQLPLLAQMEMTE